MKVEAQVKPGTRSGEVEMNWTLCSTDSDILSQQTSRLWLFVILAVRRCLPWSPDKGLVWYELEHRVVEIRRGGKLRPLTFQSRSVGQHVVMTTVLYSSPEWKREWPKRFLDKLSGRDEYIDTFIHDEWEPGTSAPFISSLLPEIYDEEIGHWRFLPPAWALVELGPTNFVSKTRDWAWLHFTPGETVKTPRELWRRRLWAYTVQPFWFLIGFGLVIVVGLALFIFLLFGFILTDLFLGVWQRVPRFGRWVKACLVPAQIRNWLASWRKRRRRQLLQQYEKE
jgi:hypothetical protein